MTGKYFLDTNFLVYCFSNDEPEKRQKCLNLLARGKGQVSFVISTQVLNEFAAVMIGKLRQPPIEVKAIIRDLALFEVVNMDVSHIQEAIDIHTLHQISYWDSLIISAAKSARCGIILTEDMNHGQEVAGVKVQNPFLE
ncbi:MAG: PIN domain-containing protein [Saprospiraceae bacterium]|nr:PIN domain-containing protein [Saprospiraceae bacterium]MCB0626309.1 PIN domain-containing protein [Saprospiraceae bacterium]MCB0682787.1 PIN domain-containing protein [Saprospiraceae bacterium]